MELRAGDPQAARGFLLSGAGMLPNRSANVLTQAIEADASEAELEVAAPGFRTQRLSLAGPGAAPARVGLEPGEAPVTVVARVTDPSGQPLGDASVGVVQPSPFGERDPVQP